MTPRAHPETAPEGIAWHALSAEATASLHVTDPALGLTAEEAAERRAVLPRDAVRFPAPTWRFVGRTVPGVVIILLATTVALRHWLDAMVALALLALNLGIAISQGRQVKNARSVFRQRKKWRAKILRDGTLVKAPAAEIAPGDVIVVEAGDIVPADARLFLAESLACREQPLVRSPVPAGKFAAAVPAEAPIVARSGMIHMGTRVASGYGRAIVVATGADTAIGRLARQATGEDP